MSLVFTKAAENRQGNGDPGASVDCSDFLAGHIRSNVQYQNAGKKCDVRTYQDMSGHLSSTGQNAAILTSCEVMTS